ncbi:MAG: pseudouridine synthase [Fidelibacterota bacterium]
MRLNKYLARCGIASRREADRLIQAATTTVNGVIMMDPAYDVQDGDVVEFDNQVVRPVTQESFYMLNKPKGVLSTTSDPFGRKSVVDLLPVRERLFPVGRLDKDTTGLLILTNSGEIANRLMHPRYRVARIYEAVIDQRLSDRQIQRMRRKIYLGENEFGRAEVVKQTTVKKRTTVILRLYEGKNREIRRMFFHLDIHLFSLVRIQFGPLKLDRALKPGTWRKLNPEEIRALKKLTAGETG